VDGDPGHILEIVKKHAKTPWKYSGVEAAAEVLGSTPGFIQSVMDRFREDDGVVDVEAFPLAAGEALPSENLPAWLRKPLPKDAKARRRWPSGAKSPSWFRMIGKCARKHAQRYRYKLPDPSGLTAIVGNALHGAFQSAALYRIHKRGVPMCAGKDELLYHLEHQPEVVHDRGTEVLKRCREVIENMKATIELNNVWGAEFVWSFNASAGLLIAGIADLILVFPDRANPAGPPELVIVVDYKTGPATIPSKDELRNDPQVCLELIWARRFFHNAKRVQFKLWNVTQNEEVTIDWDHQIERTTLSFVRACWHLWTNKIESPNVTSDCRFCPYRNDCKAYTQELHKEAYRPKAGSLDNLTIGELMATSYRSRVIEDLAGTRRKDANDLIMALLAGRRKHRDGRFLALRKTRKTESFSGVSDVLFKVSEASGVSLGPLLDACASLGDGRKLKAWLKTLPDGKREHVTDIVAALTQKRSSPPWIEVRDQGALF
jgi:RecB family exonuclease